MSGAYGLFGIILSLTFKMNRVGYSTYNWRPIPRIEDYMPRAPEPIPDYLINIFEVSNVVLSCIVHMKHNQSESTCFPPIDILLPDLVLHG